MTISKRAFAMCLCLCLAAWPSRLPCQVGPVTAVVGVNTLTDGSGEGMFGVEVRVAAGPRAWPVRPTAGLAAFTQIYGGQTELQLGAETRVPLGGPLALGLGAGFSYLSLDGAAARGRSGAGYIRAGILAGAGSPALGLDVRVLAGPDRRREDGLYYEVGFVQVGLAVMLGRR